MRNALGWGRHSCLPYARQTGMSAPPTVMTELNVIQTPFCGDLRSKKYFLFESLPTDASEFLDPSGYCWCYHTQLPVGPDGESAEPDLCRPGRSCYRSALAPE